MLRADGNRIGNAVEEVKLLYADAVNFVQYVENGDVAPALGLEDVDEVVDSRIASNRDIGRVDLVFVHHRLDLVVVNV